MNIEELLKGKETVIKGKEYLSTDRYVSPFLSRVKEIATDFKVIVKTPDQITDGAITYNRVLIQAFTNKTIDNYNECICFSYALDVRKPVAKFYKAYVNKDTGVMLAFNPMWQTCVEIEPEEPIDFSGVKAIIEATDDMKSNIDSLDNCYIELIGNDAKLGSWIKNALISESSSPFGRVKISTSSVIDAYKSLVIDSDSDYYLSGGTVSMMHITEAFGQIIADDNKDFINKFEKTLLINNIV